MTIHRLSAIALVAVLQLPPMVEAKDDDTDFRRLRHLSLIDQRDSLFGEASNIRARVATALIFEQGFGGIVLQRGKELLIEVHSDPGLINVQRV